MSLAELRDEVIDLLEDELSTIAGGAPVTAIGGAFERVSELFEALGIADLLLFADTDRYRKNLVLSGYARRYHLRRIAQEGAVDTEYRAISRSLGYVDALAGRHTALAGEIAAASVRSWVPQGEYEEDYCYAQFLHDYAAGASGAPAGDLSALIDRAESVLEGAEDPRFAVCRALIERDAGAFLEGFDDVVRLRENWVSLNEVLLAHDPAFLIRSRLFVEGMVLLDLARAAGFEIEPEYRLCPSVARLEPTSQWPNDLFAEVDRIAAEERLARASEAE